MGRVQCLETSTIENLPNDVLLLILSLSCTTLAERARTSILSRRWRNLWLYTTRLDFDATTVLHTDQLQTSHDWYIEWVNKVIDARIALPGLPSVKELRIRYNLHATRGAHIDRWITFAIANQVEILYLEFGGYDSNTLEYDQYELSEECWLKVPSGLSSLKCLKWLSLSCVNVSKQCIEFILSSCPQLEDLELHFARCFVDLDVSGVPPLQLRRLKISFAEDFALRKVCAPYLTSLHYESRGFNPEKIDVPMLTDLTIGGVSTPRPIMTFLEPFWNYLPQLEKLELIMCQAVRNFFTEPMPKLLVKLKYLKIWVSAGGVDCIFRPLIKFINDCPMLETFEMQVLYVDEGIISQTLSIPQLQMDFHELEKECSFQCLKVLKLCGSLGKTIDQEVTRFIIRNSPNLEKLSIDIRLSWKIFLWSPRPEIVEAVEAKAKELCRGSNSEIEITVIG